VNRRAALALDGAAGEAWAPLARSLGAHASDADDRKGRDPEEPPRHYLDIDVYEPWPFDGVPRTWEGMVDKYGRSRAERWGRAPWAIEESYANLVWFLERRDWSAAGAWAADLGHYVADIHQPLHCTVNYDGQQTGHDGVHLRFEVTMMNRHFEEESLEIGPVPAYEGPAAAAALEWIAEAYPGLSPLLAADETARASDPALGDRYYEVLWRETAPLARERLEAAVVDLASMYHAAWEEAGRPAPPAEPPPLRLVTPGDADAEGGEGGGLRRGALVAAAAVLAAGLVLGAR
jgi:hypothetical protein